MTKTERNFLERVARETIETKLYHDFYAGDINDPERIAARQRMEETARRAINARERGLITEQEAFYSIITIQTAPK